MALINSSNFVGDRQVPNFDKPAISERLTWFIEKHQPEVLRDIFGYELYKAFSTGIATYDPNNNNIPAIEAKWLNLINGAEYTLNSKTRKFEGLRSIITNYVYWYWLKDQHTQTVGLGEVQAKGENSEMSNPAEKMVKAWNEMSEQVAELYNFLQQNKTTYPEWESQDKCSVLLKFKEVNLWGF